MPHRRWPGLLRSPVYRWLDARRGVLALGVMFLLVVGGFGVVQKIADDAQEAADSAQAAADDAQASADSAHRDAEIAQANAGDIGEIACGIARLVSYVPALQFEGEPRSNFINWILSRRALLLIVQSTDACSDRITAILANRVRLDEIALEQLGVDFTPGNGQPRPDPEVLPDAQGPPRSITPITPPTGSPGGGDDLGSTGDGGGGQPGGGEPPTGQPEPDPPQGIADPVIDPLPPVEQCEVVVGAGGVQVTVCTEPDS